MFGLITLFLIIIFIRSFIIYLLLILNESYVEVIPNRSLNGKCKSTENKSQKNIPSYTFFY